MKFQTAVAAESEAANTEEPASEAAETPLETPLENADAPEAAMEAAPEAEAEQAPEATTEATETPAPAEAEMADFTATETPADGPAAEQAAFMAEQHEPEDEEDRETEAEPEGEFAFSLRDDAQHRDVLVIDSGATRTVGSVLALEALLESLEPRDVRTDVARRPRFRFGNGSRGIASSTAYLRLGSNPLSELDIAVLETDTFVPVLLSMEWLRAAGAIINFGNGTMSCSEGNHRRITLRALPSGHLGVTLQDLQECLRG